MSKRQEMFEDYLPGRRKKIHFNNTTQGKEETLEKSLYLKKPPKVKHST